MPANQPLLAFRVDDQRYAVRLPAVMRVLAMLHVDPLPGSPDVVSGIINVAGSVFPVMNLRRRLRLPERDSRLSDVLILARAGELAVALPADGVVGVMAPAHPPQPVAEIVPGVAYVAGIVKLDDGLLLIHDLDAFLSLREGEAVRRALNEVESAR